MTSINMGSTSKKSKASMRSESCDDTRDRLSELPDEILVHILSFLPILDAVRTVLIRRFGNLWTLVSSLDFNEYECVKANSWYSDEMDSDNKAPQFGRFVRNVLMLHRGFPVNKFLLQLEDTDVADDQDLDFWIKFAMDRQVKELKVQFDFEECIYILPHFVFTSQFLVKLEIVQCEIEGLSKVHMGSLRNLSLVKGRVSNKMFKKVIFGCPSLQELVLTDVDELEKLQFTAPNIVKFYLDTYNIRACLD